MVNKKKCLCCGTTIYGGEGQLRCSRCSLEHKINREKKRRLEKKILKLEKKLTIRISDEQIKEANIKRREVVKDEILERLKMVVIALSAFTEKNTEGEKFIKETKKMIEEWEK